MSSIQAPLENIPFAKLPLKCQKWMSDLWADLSARSEAHDEFVNSMHARIIGKHIDHLQPELQVKLAGAADKCSLTVLVGDCSELHWRTRDYQESAMDVRKNALATIAEDRITEDQIAEDQIAEAQTVKPELPRCHAFLKSGISASWIRGPLWAYVRYITSDLADASIKPRRGKGIGMVVAEKRHCGPSRADLQSPSKEAAVIQTMTVKIAEYTQLLDRFLVDANFLPRVIEIFTIMEVYEDDHLKNFASNSKSPS
ncbi:hypothetical protein MMC29_007806 [Sticta canariensis]|nr:hypothetical protein [Sticta canariensis]